MDQPFLAVSLQVFAVFPLGSTTAPSQPFRVAPLPDHGALSMDQPGCCQRLMLVARSGRLDELPQLHRGRQVQDVRRDQAGGRDADCCLRFRRVIAACGSAA